MTKVKKIVRRVISILIIIVPVAAFAHYIIFPQETRSILIDFSTFKREQRIYFNQLTPPGKIDSLKDFIAQAFARIDEFWGKKTCNPKFICCVKADDFRKYCASAAPAVTYLKLGSYIVLSNDGIDPDIISHEISHAEFYERIGFYNWSFRVPAWFKHGLAMQNDYRSYYSGDTLKIKSNNFKNLPDIKLITTDKNFYDGSTERVMLNYMLAKQEVKTWYTKRKLEKLINDINAGKSFSQAYRY